MQTLFVLVKCELGRAYDVADAAIQEMDAVSEVHSISGQYDLLMKVYDAEQGYQKSAIEENDEALRCDNLHSDARELVTDHRSRIASAMTEVHVNESSVS